jgi:hypothetical protein
VVRKKTVIELLSGIGGIEGFFNFDWVERVVGAGTRKDEVVEK